MLSCLLILLQYIINNSNFYPRVSPSSAIVKNIWDRMAVNVLLKTPKVVLQDVALALWGWVSFSDVASLLQGNLSSEGHGRKNQ